MKYGQMTLSVEVVTPAVARRWLDSNTNNRRLRKTVVEQYAADMTSGAWERKHGRRSFPDAAGVRRMKLWHNDPPSSPATPEDRNARDGRSEILITLVIAALGVLGLYVSRGG